MDAMIFAAGLGTRLRPLTNERPKALVPVNGVPMLERVIIRLRDAGYSRIVVNVHHFGEQIIDFLSSRDFGVEIVVSDERAKLLDTGGAVRHAMPLFTPGEPVLVHNADIITDVDLSSFGKVYKDSGVAAALLVSKRKSSRYLYFDGEKSLCGWQNQKTGEVKSPLEVFSVEDYTPYAFNGIHILSPDLISDMAEWPDKFSIIDFYLTESANNQILAVPMSEESHWFDVGKPETLKEAELWLDGKR